MADEPKPASKSLTTADYVNGLNETLKLMRFDAKVQDSPSFLPTYNYNSSSLKGVYEGLAKDFGAQPGIPAAILDQMKGLEGNFKDTVRDVANSQFKEVNFTSPLAALQSSIDAAKAKPAADQEPGQDNAALDKLGEAIKKIQAEALHKEFEQTERSLRLQNQMNLEAAFANEAMQTGPYAKNRASFYVNGWVNETNNDSYSDEQLQRMKDSGLAISSQGQLHNGADGVYSKPDSFYKVEKRTGENGAASYTATYSNVPKGELQGAAENLIDAVVVIARFYLSITLVLPLLELAVAAVNYAVTQGQKPSPLGDSQWTRMFNNGGIFENREGTSRGEVKAEIDVARNRGKERGMVFDVKQPSMDSKDLEKLTVYIDEIKKRGGYEPGADNGPGRMTTPKSAMDFQITINAESKLRALASSQQPTKETMQLVESFYKSQHGNMKGYDPAKFKEIIFREIKNIQMAYAPLRAPGQDATNKQSSEISPAGNSNTSVITPTAGGPTSVISPTTPGATSVISPSAAAATSVISPVPSAPPEPPKFNAVEMVARQMAMDRITDHALSKFYTMIIEPTDTLPETVKNACDALKGLTDKGPEDIAMFTAFELKENIDLALQTLSPEEIVTMEEAGELKNYHEAVATMPKESNGKAKYPESPAIQAALDNAPEKPALGRLGGKLPEPPPAPEGAPAPTAPRMK
jgi:hypothetical protein